MQSIANPVVWICGTAETWAPFFFVVGAERFTYGLANVAVIKEAMELLGFAPGRVRKPCSELHETDRRELVRILRSWGKLDEWSDTVR